MNSWLLVLTATAIVLILLCRINIYIDLRFCRRGDNDFIAVTVHALQKLFLYNVHIPIIMLIQHNDLPWVTSKIETSQTTTKTKVNREQRFVKKTINLLIYKPDRFWRLFKLAKYIYRGYLDYMNKLSQKIYCEKLDLKTTYGFEDAAYTGIFTGILASVIQLFLTSMHNRIALTTQPTIQIRPNYEHRQVELELSCIFRIRLGNVITATIATLRNLLHTEATGSG